MTFAFSRTSDTFALARGGKRYPDDPEEVEVHTIEELRETCDRLDCGDVIVRFGDEPSIEDYDDYRE